MLEEKAGDDRGYGEEAAVHEGSETQADEAMITTMIYDHAARKRSYVLLAEAFSLASPHAKAEPQAAAS